MKKISAVLLFILYPLLFSSCAGPRGKIWIKEGLSVPKQARFIVTTDLSEDVLLQAEGILIKNGFRILDRDVLQQYAREKGFSASDVTNKGMLIKIAKALSTDILMEVSGQYELYVRWISVETGEILATSEKDNDMRRMLQMLVDRSIEGASKEEY